MRRRSWPWLTAIVLGAAACFLFLAGRSLPTGPGRESSYRDFQYLGTVIHLIRNDYVEEPNPAKTMEGAFRGLVDSLDTLSTYFTPADASKYQESLKTEFKDIGAVLIKVYGGFPQVVGLVENSPAEKAGLKLGDYISAINNRSTFGLSLVETQLALKSPKSDPVQVKVLRQAQTLHLTLDRQGPIGPPVSFAPAGGTAGILRLGKIGAQCASEVRAVLAAKLKNPDGPLVLDLRNCDEGQPEVALQVLNLFLQSDRAATLLKRQGPPEVLSCPQKALWDKLPLAVWVNAGTQGAAELLAAILQDLRQAKVVGRMTPGLAARSRFLPLQDGSALLLTTGVYALNSGKKIWGGGVKPDAEVEAIDDSPNAYLQKTLPLFASH